MQNIFATPLVASQEPPLSFLGGRVMSSITFNAFVLYNSTEVSDEIGGKNNNGKNNGKNKTKIDLQ
jgi:hypothetical protein